MRVVGFSGGLSVPSKTLGLVDAILDEFARDDAIESEIIDLASVATAFGSALYRSQLAAEHELLLQRIEQADVIVVASPVYRAAYPGLFKHVFDLIEREALEHKIVVLAANGGSGHHALIIESHLRPLFTNLGAYTVPTGIYSQTQDFSGYQLTSEAVLSRIADAVAEARHLRSRLTWDNSPVRVAANATA